jgi:uncharacterized SAM-binding protein YcdF (DUF218 family)
MAGGDAFGPALTPIQTLGAVSLLGFALAAFTPAVHLIGQWTTPDRPAERAEAIVVLGIGGVAPGGGLTDPSLRATMEGVKLFHEGWAPLLVLSGDAGRRGRTEAELRAEFARQSGVPASAIVTVPPAHTTREEAARARALLEPRGIRKILLVVDGPGVMRALGVFRRVGFDAVPAPWTDDMTLDAAPEERLNQLRALAMEALARLYYRVMGYV